MNVTAVSLNDAPHECQASTGTITKTLAIVQTAEYPEYLVAELFLDPEKPPAKPFKMLKPPQIKLQ